MMEVRSQISPEINLKTARPDWMGRQTLTAINVLNRGLGDILIIDDKEAKRPALAAMFLDVKPSEKVLEYLKANFTEAESITPFMVISNSPEDIIGPVPGNHGFNNKTGEIEGPFGKKDIELLKKGNVIWFIQGEEGKNAVATLTTTKEETFNILFRSVPEKPFGYYSVKNELKNATEETILQLEQLAEKREKESIAAMKKDLRNGILATTSVLTIFSLVACRYPEMFCVVPTLGILFGALIGGLWDQGRPRGSYFYKDEERIKKRNSILIEPAETRVTRERIAGVIGLKAESLDLNSICFAMTGKIHEE